MTKLSVRHLLGIKNLNENDIQTILETATEFKDVINRPIKKVPSLRDITIANVFFENSTRTRLSFELAEKRLSADFANKNGLPHYSRPFHVNPPLSVFVKNVIGFLTGVSPKATICLTEY